MNHRLTIFYCLLLLFLFPSYKSITALHVDITVDCNGNGDYITLTEAIDALPMYCYERVVVMVKNGVYNEKIRIEQDNVTIIGESRDSTIIQYNQLREDWQKNKDYIGPAVINIHADHIILENITIKNTQPKVGPHAFTIYGTGTFIILKNCAVTSNGGDTVSLWDYKTGMYYHSDCYFEGCVDFVCPRGWCYIKNSGFYELKKTATIWHAATTDKNQKFVIKNSYFDGVEGFCLGRHHYEAQFYLINCNFSGNMADKPIWHVTYKDRPEKNRPYFFGDRYYYSNCHKTGGDYSWFADNMPVDEKQIIPEWTFDGKWNPESTLPPKVVSWQIKDSTLTLYFDELLTLRDNPVLKTRTGKTLEFISGHGREIVTFKADTPLSDKDFEQPLAIIKGEIVGNTATVTERAVSNTFSLQ